MVPGCGGGDGSENGPRTRVALRPTGFDAISTGKSVKLAGRLDPESDASVEIQSDPYPFDRFEREGSTRATDGTFKFSTRVMVNTRYRAIAKGVTSAPTKIYASPVVEVKAGARAGVFKAVVLVRVPRGLRPKRGREWVYRTGTGLRYGRVGSASRYVTADGDLAAVIKAPLARVHAGDRFFACSRNDYVVGMSRPGLQLKRCGDAAFEVDQIPPGGD
jgi:hypothetical protein